MTTKTQPTTEQNLIETREAMIMYSSRETISHKLGGIRGWYYTEPVYV